MSSRMRPRPAARYALRLGGLLVVLAGLFGMHGLDNHGGAGMDVMSHAAMEAPAGGAASGHDAVTGTGHVGAAAVAVVGGAGDVVAAMTSSTGHRGVGMGAAGVCMAVLVLSLLLLIMGLFTRRMRPLLWLAARPVRSVLAHGRDPDPPSLLDLSIQRC